MSGPLPRARSIAEIVGGAFDVLRRHFAVLVVTAAVLGLPGALLGLGGAAVPESGGEIAIILAVSVVDVLAAVVAIVQVACALRGGEPALAGGVTSGVQRLLPALGALGLSTVWVLAVATVAGLVLGGVWVAAPRSDDPRLVALEASVLLLGFLVPVTWMMMRYFFVMVVAALEPGVPPLRRSIALARGAYWKIGVIGLIGWLVWAPATILPWADAFGALAGDEPGAATGTGFELAAWLAGALAVPLSAALTVLLYDDQRARKDPAG